MERPSSVAHTQGLAVLLRHSTMGREVTMQRWFVVVSLLVLGVASAHAQNPALAPTPTQAAFNALQAEMNTLKAQVASGITILSGTQARIAALEAAVTALTARVAALEAGSGSAEVVALRWQPNPVPAPCVDPHSVSCVTPTVGYQVLASMRPRQYDEAIDVGTATAYNYRVRSRPRYITVVAYDAQGRWSAPMPEVVRP